MNKPVQIQFVWRLCSFAVHLLYEKGCVKSILIFNKYMVWFGFQVKILSGLCILEKHAACWKKQMPPSVSCLQDYALHPRQ